jgi:hypothetical protein
MNDMTLIEQFRASVDLLPSTAPRSELHRLLTEALDADAAFRDSPDDDDEYARLDAKQYDTRQALLNHLLNAHGITRSLAGRMGEIL